MGGADIESLSGDEEVISLDESKIFHLMFVSDHLSKGSAERKGTEQYSNNF